MKLKSTTSGIELTAANQLPKHLSQYSITPSQCMYFSSPPTGNELICQQITINKHTILYWNIITKQNESIIISPGNELIYLMVAIKNSIRINDNKGQVFNLHQRQMNVYYFPHSYTIELKKDTEYSFCSVNIPFNQIPASPVIWKKFSERVNSKIFTALNPTNAEVDDFNYNYLLINNEIPNIEAVVQNSITTIASLRQSKPLDENKVAAIYDLENYIAANLNKNILLTDFLAPFKSERELNKYFQRLTAQTIRGFQLEHRMKRAAELLLDPNEKYTIRFIASQVGYNSDIAFNHACQDYFSLSPTAFREKNLYKKHAINNSKNFWKAIS